MSISILGGLGKTSVFLNVNGVAEVDFDLTRAPPKNTISGTRAVTLGDAKKDLDGTVGADVGVSINAGTTKTLRPFFQASDSVPLFSKTFFRFQVRASYLLYRNHTDLVISHRIPSESLPRNLPRNAPFRSERPISPAYPALPLESPTSSSPSLTWMPQHPHNESTMSARLCLLLYSTGPLGNHDCNKSLQVFIYAKYSESTKNARDNN
jgi:hypothetical protein